MILNRRHFLASSTSLLALPQLQLAASETGKAPQRVVFLGFGFGFTEDFYATTFGSDYELTPQHGIAAEAQAGLYGHQQPLA